VDNKVALISCKILGFLQASDLQIITASMKRSNRKPSAALQQGAGRGGDFAVERSASKKRLRELQAYLERFSWRCYLASKYWNRTGMDRGGAS
jgi:hypothetical protein